MAYEWLTSAEFKERVNLHISSSSYNSGMKEWENGISTRLMEYIAKNRQIIESKEMVKQGGLRRTEADALASVDSVIKVASELAKNEGRTLVKIGDFETAVQRTWCKIWPICSGDA
jgi:hypothetical protein